MRAELRDVILSGDSFIDGYELTVFTWNILPPPSVEPASLFKWSIGKYAGKGFSR